MKDLKHLIWFEDLLQQANNELVQRAAAEGQLALGKPLLLAHRANALSQGLSFLFDVHGESICATINEPTSNMKPQPYGETDEEIRRPHGHRLGRQVRRQS